MSTPAGWPGPDEETPAVYACAGLATAQSSGSAETEPENQGNEEASLNGLV